MFSKSIFLIGIFYFTFIEGRFRLDYSFSSSANGWLKTHVIPATWSDARLICNAEGAVLASPLTYELLRAILYKVEQEEVSIRTIFTGVHTRFSKGVYASIEGVPLSEMSISWAPGEPNNLENSESCLAMWTFEVQPKNGTMMDVKCSEVLPFVCYKKKTHTPVVTGCGTSDSEYSFDPRTGSCYKFHRHGMAWPQAYMTCMAEEAHLIVINSDVEAQVVRDIYAKNPENTIFAKFPYAAIGTYDLNDGAHWMTIHGETPAEAGYSKWQPGEPNNGSQPRGEFCGVTHRNNGFLHDAPCDWVVPFICEKPIKNLEDSTEND